MRIRTPLVPEVSDLSVADPKGAKKLFHRVKESICASIMVLNGINIIVTTVM